MPAVELFNWQLIISQMQNYTISQIRPYKKSQKAMDYFTGFIYLCTCNTPNVWNC